jgi:hypothetical protein
VFAYRGGGDSASRVLIYWGLSHLPEYVIFPQKIHLKALECMLYQLKFIFHSFQYNVQSVFW